MFVGFLIAAIGFFVLFAFALRCKLSPKYRERHDVQAILRFLAVCYHQNFEVPRGIEQTIDLALLVGVFGVALTLAGAFLCYISP
jgi:hypothetical protein